MDDSPKPKIKTDYSVKWIKLTIAIFEDEKIQLIEAMPEGDTVLVCWLKLLCMAGKMNQGGYVFLNERVPYTDEMLSVIWHKKLPIVRLAIKTFTDMGMIEIEQNGNIFLNNFQKYQEQLRGLEEIREAGRLRTAKYRAKLNTNAGQEGVCVIDKNVTEQNRTEENVSCNVTVTSQLASNPIKTVDLFATWYAIYPRKVGRGAAVSAFTAAMKKVSMDVLMEATGRYVKACVGTEAQFIPHPATWLNGERWADESYTPAKKSTTPWKEIYKREDVAKAEKLAHQQDMEIILGKTRADQLAQQRKDREMGMISGRTQDPATGRSFVSQPTGIGSLLPA